MYRDYSSKMWQNGKELLKYILRRGGRVGLSATGFTIADISAETNVADEMSSLAMSLDMLKQRTEDAIKVHESSQKRNLDGYPKVFDPAVNDLLRF